MIWGGVQSNNEFQVVYDNDSTEISTPNTTIFFNKRTSSCIYEFRSQWSDVKYSH